MKRSWFAIVLCGIAAFFFLSVIASAPQVGEGRMFFDSPDETANYFWTQRVADGKPLWYEEPLEVIGNSLLKPRSINVVGTRVVPGSFIGLPLLYGYMAKWLGVNAIPYLTPLFASLAVIAFGFLMRKLCDPVMGLLSAALLAVLPPWFYYASRGMYHNVLFVSLVIVGICLLVNVCFWIPSISVRNDGSGKTYLREVIKLITYGIAGLFIGFSLVVRSSELIWVASLVFFCLLFLWRRVNILGLMLFLACGLFAFIPLFVNNIALYGAPISIGYRGVQGMELGDFISKLPEPQFRNLFFAPFGISMGQIRITVVRFLVEFYWWWFLAVVAGVMTVVARMTRKRDRREIKTWGGYLLVAAVAGTVLIVYYGSWAFSDRIDRQIVSLNTSFFRYWLPIFVLGIPVIAALIVHSARLMKSKWLQVIAMCALVAAFALPSAMKVLNGTDESLWKVQVRLHTAPLELAALQAVVPRDAVVVTFPQADKVLFPVYPRLISALVTPEDYRAVGQLAQKLPVYYYTYAPPEFVEFIIAPVFKSHGLQVREGKEVFTHRWVWRILPDMGSFALR
ncbi:MAG: hypothetical protein AB1352_04040 [Patescibacteria group bacterium]